MMSQELKVQFERKNSKGIKTPTSSQPDGKWTETITDKKDWSKLLSLLYSGIGKKKWKSKSIWECTQQKIEGRVFSDNKTDRQGYN